MNLRLALSKDAENISAIYNEFVSSSTATFDTEPRSVAAQNEILRTRSPQHPITVVETNGRVVAWGSLNPWSDRLGYRFSGETSVYVTRDHHGKGIGKLLLADIVERARTLGFHTLLARISTDNPPSLRLHEHFGFTQSALLREVGYKFDRWIDVAILQKIL